MIPFHLICILLFVSRRTCEVWHSNSGNKFKLSPWTLTLSTSLWPFCVRFILFLFAPCFCSMMCVTGAKVGEAFCESCMFHCIFFVPEPQTSHALLLVVSHAQSLVTSPQATIIIGLLFSPHPLSFYSKAQVWRCMQESRGREQGSSWSAVLKTSKSIHRSNNVIPE